MENTSEKPTTLATASTCSGCTAKTSPAAKAAGIRLIELRLAKGLGGKAFFTMTGEVFEVEAAMDAALRVVGAGGNLVRSVVIPRPHEDLTPKIT